MHLKSAMMKMLFGLLAMYDRMGMQVKQATDKEPVAQHFDVCL